MLNCCVRQSIISLTYKRNFMRHKCICFIYTKRVNLSIISFISVSLFMYFYFWFDSLFEKNVGPKKGRFFR